jgi:hypothetical protein
VSQVPPCLHTKAAECGQSLFQNCLALLFFLQLHDGVAGDHGRRDVKHRTVAFAERATSPTIRSAVFRAALGSMATRMRSNTAFFLSATAAAGLGGVVTYGGRAGDLHADNMTGRLTS